MGTVLSERAVGDGARRLLASRHGLGVLSTRPRPLPRLPLERGRHRRHLRPPPVGFASPLALWNGQDPILKERLFGLTGNEGKHGEDVKEYYFYLDSTPTHSYMKYLYKYPQRAFPYAKLIEENGRRGRVQPEYELLDTGVFEGDRYFDVFVEYAKAAPEDILIRITVCNRGAAPAHLDLLPQLWFRNTWSWGLDARKPRMEAVADAAAWRSVHVAHYDMADRWLLCEGAPELLFTENETNFQRLYGAPNHGPYVKDAINDYIVAGKSSAVNPGLSGTKAAARYRLDIGGGESAAVNLRLTLKPGAEPFGSAFEKLLRERGREADEFYEAIAPKHLDADERLIQRQAFAGLLWSKQFYHYNVRRWLRGDPSEPEPPRERLHGRNSRWTHLNNADIISMPGQVGVPVVCRLGPGVPLRSRWRWSIADFAKEQLLLLLREWYMHPNGQLPAYEWNFSAT